MRPHVKMLIGNYVTFEMKSQQSGGSPYCRLCQNINNNDDGNIESNNFEVETVEHLISTCKGLSETRTNILKNMKNMCIEADVKIDIDNFTNNELTQYILDPSSLNLTNRVSINHPILPKLFQLSRDFCYKIDRTRMKLSS